MMTSTRLEVGRRYINAKNHQPLTLLYVGPLPPQNPSEGESSSSSTQWLGVEYDDPTHGKGHSGTYEGIQVFQTRQEGAGAFIRLKTGNELVEGKTFVEAIKERYGYEHDAGLASDSDLGKQEYEMESVILGSSSSAIVVEAPGMMGVTKRLKNLEKLRQIGLEDEFICGVGGTEAERLDLGERFKGVTMLNISRNLITTWTEVEAILKVVSGVSTLIMNDSRLRSEDESNLISQITELYLARSNISWADVDGITRRFEKLEELHLSGNPLLSKSPSDATRTKESIRVLSLKRCEMNSWEDIETSIAQFPMLEILNISDNPLDPIIRGSEAPALQRLKNIILLSSTLDSHISLANLSARVPNLETLRFSLAPIPQTVPGTEGPRLSGNDEEDSGVLIALFPHLKLLNGDTVNGRKREDAERRWCTRFVPHEAAPILERVYDELSRKHTLQASDPIAAVASTSLRSKLITLHVYPPSPSAAFTLQLLPSAPISLARRKIAKKLGMAGDDIKLYTVKRVQSDVVHEDKEVWEREKVAEVDEGEVGFWFDDGDGVIVEGA